MKKILLVAYNFAPQNTIGAVRLTKLAKYLTEYGYEVTVITSTPDSVDVKLNEDIKYVNTIIRVDHSKIYKQYIMFYQKLRNKFIKRDKPSNNSVDISNQSSTSKESPPKESLIKKCYRFVENLNALLTEEDYYRRVTHHIKKNELSFSSYHSMITTFNTMGNHKIGKYIKEHQKNIYWIADYRDPVITDYTETKLRRRVYRNLQSKVIKQSDYLVAVSKGYLKMITSGKYSEKTKVIYNGFDTDDYTDGLFSKLIDVDTKKLRLVYTGGLYAGDRDLTPILRALSLLLEENIVEESNVELIYAGQEKGYFDSLIKTYGLENITKSFDFITRSEALALQNSSDILIVATWNRSDYFGVLPGKLFEYMQARKSIIAVVSGDQGESEMKEIINECNIGVCYENANKVEDFNNLYEFIKQAYQSKLIKGEVPLNSDQLKVEEFNYKNITKQFINLIDKQ